MPTVSVSLLPSLIGDENLSESTCVIIDILRASTTIIHALENGARAVIPCLTVEDAQAAAKAFPVGTALLGGERGGEQIPGFDLDNSPFKYAPEVVQGKTVIFTTTNGTRALWAAQSAQQIVIGAFVNRAALVKKLQATGKDVFLICAGTNGQLTAEDVLFAGAILNDLIKNPDENSDESSVARTHAQWVEGNLQAKIVLDYFQQRCVATDHFRDEFLDSLGSRNLCKLQMQRDIERCMENNLFEGVPVWDSETRELKLQAIPDA